jgi:hypothetical protein
MSTQSERIGATDDFEEQQRGRLVKSMRLLPACDATVGSAHI